MKYMISWFERPQGSPTEYENAQKRILEVFTQWKAPANFKIELFVVRVGEWGGHMLVDCDDPLAVHKVCSTWPAFEFQARPVIAVEDAVRVALSKRLLGAMDSNISDIREYPSKSPLRVLAAVDANPNQMGPDDPLSLSARSAAVLGVEAESLYRSFR